MFSRIKQIVGPRSKEVQKETVKVKLAFEHNSIMSINQDLAASIGEPDFAGKKILHYEQEVYHHQNLQTKIKKK